MTLFSYFKLLIFMLLKEPLQLFFYCMPLQSNKFFSYHTINQLVVNILLTKSLSYSQCIQSVICSIDRF